MFIHADESRQELGVLQEITEGDFQVSQRSGAGLIDNTFSVSIPEKLWKKDPILEGHYVYVPQTEYGGLVTYIRHSTEDQTVTVQGQCWRGILFQRTIDPPSGSGYLTVTDMDANELIDEVTDGKFGDWVVPESTAAGTDVSGQYRYEAVASGLHRTLRAYGLRLQVVYDNVYGVLRLSAEPVNDLTDSVEISQDYGVHFTSEEGNLELCNHCLALGSGELTERMVRNVYIYNGTVYYSRPSGIAEEDVRTVVLDYPNAEDETELLRSAAERLMDKQPIQGITVDELTLDVSAELGDLIGVRDRLTGLTAVSEITEKILTIRDGRIEIAVKVAVQ